MSDPIENPFRPKDEDAPDLSDPAARLECIRKAGKEMNETLARFSTGEVDPIDLIMETLASAFTCLEVAEAAVVNEVEGASL